MNLLRVKLSEMVSSLKYVLRPKYVFMAQYLGMVPPHIALEASSYSEPGTMAVLRLEATQGSHNHVSTTTATTTTAAAKTGDKVVAPAAVKKRNVNSFILFIKDHYAEAKSLPASERIPFLAKTWVALPQAEKESYAARARQGEGAKAVVGVNQDKKIGPYIIYAREHYGKLEGGLEDRAKKLAESWKKLSDEEKEVYRQKAKAGYVVAVDRPSRPRLDKDTTPKAKIPTEGDGEGKRGKGREL